MNLQAYFKQLQEQKLSDQQKNAIYGSILSKMEPTKPIFSRMRFYAKLAGYALFLGLLGFSIYMPFLSQESDSGVKMTAHADYVAKVVDIKGQYYIEADGQRIEGNNVSNGNTVVLAKDSSLIVHVGDHIEGKVTGPATFTIDRKGEWYGITLKDGNYVEISTLGDQKDAPQLALVSENHKFIAQTHAGKSVHFVLEESNDKPILTNKADDSLTIINESDKDKTVELALNKTASIEDGYIFTAIASPTQVATVIAMKTNPQTPADVNYNDGFFRWMILSQDTATVNEESAAAVKASTMVAMTTDDASDIAYDAKAIRSNLLPQFVWVDVKYIAYHYLNGEDHEYQIAYTNFINRLYNIYDALHLTIPVDGVLATQKDQYSLEKLTILASYLDKHLPPKLLDYQAKTMHTLTTFLQRLNSHNFGEFKGQQLGLDELFQKIY